MLGEFGDVALDTNTKLEGEPHMVFSELDMINTLKVVVHDPHAPNAVKGVATTALLKLAVKFPAHGDTCRAAIATHKQSLHLELQQRAVEFCAVFDAGPVLSAALLERMPPITTRDEVGAATASAGRVSISGTGSSAGRNDSSNSNGGADLLGDLLGGDMSGFGSSSTGSGGVQPSGADLLQDLLGGVSMGYGGSPFSSHNANADPLAALAAGASLAGGCPSTPPRADLLHDLMGGFLPMTPTASPLGSMGGLFTQQTASADAMAGLSGLRDDPMASTRGLSDDPLSCTVAPATVVPALTSNGVSVTFSCVKPNPNDAAATTITATYANHTDETLKGFTLRAAVPKTASLALAPASASDVLANAKITQILNVANPAHQTKPLAMRLQVSWKTGGVETTETATVTFPFGF